MAERNRQQDRSKSLQAKRSRPEEHIGRECPQCGTANDSEVRFCCECGHDFTGKAECPKCGAKVHPGADICETCGAWLLDGICKFCGADIVDGQACCGECGNPVDGIVCSKCGRLSFFDFCKECVLPLTDAANAMVLRLKSAPREQPPKKDTIFSSKQEARRYYMAYLFCQQEQQKSDPAPSTSQSDTREQMLKLKSYLEQACVSTRKSKPQPLFSVDQKESIKSGSQAAEAEIKRQEEERRRREEEERRRREEEERRRRRGWLCNRFGVVHSNGPCGCSAPEHGGKWVDE